MKSLRNSAVSIYSLQIFTHFVFVFFITLPSSNCFTENYTTCSSSWTCGAISNIRYPFWGGRPQFCGLPELMLDCGNNTSSEHPILKIGRDSDRRVPYRVVAINTSNSIVTIKLQNMPFEQTCNNLVFNQPLDEYVRIHLLAYGRGVERIRLFYNCSQNLTNARLSISCQSYTGNMFTGYYQRNLSDYPNLGQNCRSTVDVPVIVSELSRLNNRNEALMDVFKQGLEMEVDVTNCSKCEDSGGECGWSNSQFGCFCKDPSSDQVCRKSKSGLITSWIVGSVFSALGISISIFIMVYCLRRRSSARKFPFNWTNRKTVCDNIDTFLTIYGSLTPKRYSYANIRKMTNGFKDKLGEGGYAIVYKGKLGGGRLVAIKVLKQSKGNGQDFINEVASIGRTNHVNIVALLGFCFEGKKKALIYEFMPNGSLERFTYCGASKESLSCEKQLDIAIGIARGLDYLHRGCNTRILHFDIKPHNILLDEEFCPKISDFGLARLCPLQESTISILEARGTIGYIAPEVFCRNFGGVSNKSDVYSFGMMVLDMVCGRVNLLADEQRSSQLNFPQWIHNQLEAGREIASPKTTNDEETTLRRTMIVVSLWCIQTYPSNRPSMSKVIEMLQGGAESIEMPPKEFPGE